MCLFDFIFYLIPCTLTEQFKIGGDLFSLKMTLVTFKKAGKRKHLNTFQRI